MQEHPFKFERLFDYQTTAAHLIVTFEQVATGIITPIKVLVQYNTDITQSMRTEQNSRKFGSHSLNSFKAAKLMSNGMEGLELNAHEQQQTDCFVCRKHRNEFAVPGGAIFEDDLLFASHVWRAQPKAEQKIYQGYLIVETKRHIPGLSDLTNIEAQALGLLVTRLSRALKVTVGAEHIYEFVLGHHVAHLHVHIVPRYPGTPREYWGIHVDEWPDAPLGNFEETDALASRLKAFLESNN